MQITEYLQDVKAELRHVKWPTRKTTTIFTVIVVILCILTALYLGAFDFIFAEFITSII